MTETRKKETKRTTVPSSLKSAVKESVQEDLSTYQKRPQGRQRRNINAIIMKRRITFALSSSRKRKDQRVFAAAIVDIVRSSVEEWEDHVIRIWQLPLFPLEKLDHPTCICRNEWFLPSAKYSLIQESLSPYRFTPFPPFKRWILSHQQIQVLHVTWN